jgi:hypothetical protein
MNKMFGRNWRIILKWLLKKSGGRICTGFIWLKTRTGGGLV